MKIKLLTLFVVLGSSSARAEAEEMPKQQNQLRAEVEAEPSPLFCPKSPPRSISSSRMRPSFVRLQMPHP